MPFPIGSHFFNLKAELTECQPSSFFMLFSLLFTPSEVISADLQTLFPSTLAPFPLNPSFDPPHLHSRATDSILKGPCYSRVRALNSARSTLAQSGRAVLPLHVHNHVVSDNFIVCTKSVTFFVRPDHISLTQFKEIMFLIIID